MVGIIDETYVKYPIESRIKIGDNYGTVKYVGEVIGYSGVWLGIEWDNSCRGKHDGCVNERRYFQTSHPTSGSFIKPGKIGPMLSLEEAARSRYLSYTPAMVDQTLIQGAQQSLQASIFEVVGMEKIARKQSKFEQLTDISVDSCAVNSAGYLRDFTMLTSLNISHTLIWNWRSVADILQQIPTLQNLDLSSNRLQQPSDKDITELTSFFGNLKHINLANCNFSNWFDVMQTAKLFPNIMSLGLQENPISKLAEVDCNTIFRNLKELDLHRTHINDFEEVCKLGNIRTLVSLNLMENAIEVVRLPDCDPSQKLYMFDSLEQLNLLNNPIWNECATFNELDKLPKLKRLSKTPHLKANFEEMFSNAVGFISNLEYVNKVQITAVERRGAEYDVWKAHAVDWLQASTNPESLQEFYKKHRSYANLIKKYGSPLEFLPNTKEKRSNLIKLRIKNHETGEIWEKKVPRMITVQTLRGLIVRHFHIEQSTLPKLSYVDAEHCELIVPMENNSKSLDFYSINDSDTILVQW